MSAAFIDCIRTDLRRAGVETADEPDTPHARDGPGEEPAPVLMALGSFDPDALRSVRRVCGHGGRRVLVTVPDRHLLLSQGVWDALAAGAADVLAWTNGGGPVRDRLRRWVEVDAILHSELVTKNLIGSSTAFRAALREVVELGRFTDASVLVTGESGTGKELVARLVHALDPKRCEHPLVVVDCTTVVPALSGSEFFGHERGAFTGAVSARDGAFALAQGGTLFLDEVGELPLELQAELLRVVQERTYKPVGSNRWRTTDFRLVCATNRDLLEEETRGQFRKDFYFRIAQCRCHLPSLRERQEDVLPLTRHVLAGLTGGAPLDLDPAVRAFLAARAYPGNVRDLRQLVTRLFHAHVGDGPITVGDIPPAERLRLGPAPVADADEALHVAVARALAEGTSLRGLTTATRSVAIEVALAEADGSVRRAARSLGVTERALQMHLRGARQRAAAGTDLASDGVHARVEEDMS